MKPYICINQDELQKAVVASYRNLETEDRLIPQRWYDWVNNNVNRFLERQVTAYFTNADPNRNLLGLTFSTRLTARDLALSGRPQWLKPEIVDLWQIHEIHRTAYQMGSLLYSWDVSSFASYTTYLSDCYDYLKNVHADAGSWSKITIEQAVQGHTDWIKQLNKKKLESLGATKIIWSKQEFEGTDCDTWYLFELLDQDAFTAEGSAMNHCVASYYGKENSRVYSLRNKEGRQATLEIRTKATGSWCAQIQALHNQRPAQNVLDVIAKWLVDSAIGDENLNPACMPKIQVQAIRLPPRPNSISIRGLANPFEDHSQSNLLLLLNALCIGATDNNVRLFNSVLTTTSCLRATPWRDTLDVRVEAEMSIAGVAYLDSLTDPTCDKLMVSMRGADLQVCGEPRVVQITKTLTSTVAILDIELVPEISKLLIR